MDEIRRESRHCWRCRRYCSITDNAVGSCHTCLQLFWLWLRNGFSSGCGWSTANKWLMCCGANFCDLWLLWFIGDCCFSEGWKKLQCKLQFRLLISWMRVLAPGLLLIIWFLVGLVAGVASVAFVGFTASVVFVAFTASVAWVVDSSSGGGNKSLNGTNMSWGGFWFMWDTSAAQRQISAAAAINNCEIVGKWC